MTIATRGQGVGIDPPESQQNTQVNINFIVGYMCVRGLYNTNNKAVESKGLVSGEIKREQNEINISPTFYSYRKIKIRTYFTRNKLLTLQPY